MCLFLLHELKSLTENVAIGLYRDDRLAFIRNVNGPIVDRIKNKITKIFQCHNLKITLEANLILADFLDITFNLKSEKYWLYRKPNNQPLYINIKSNHPLPIKKQIPQMVSGRLSQNIMEPGSIWPSYINISRSAEKKWFHWENAIHQFSHQ